MTKKRKRLLSFVCAGCMSLSLIGLGLSLSGDGIYGAWAEDALLQSFAAAENITVKTEEAFPSALQGGKKGYLFQTEKSGSALTFGESMSGNFSIDFTPVASKVGEKDFESVSFRFTSNASRLYFDISFLSTDNGVVMRLLMSNYANKYQETLVGGSFTNMSSESVGFSFDPENMRIYNAEGTLVFDLRSEEFLNEYSMTTAIPSFDEYVATMTFNGVKKGKTAKVLIYDVCGLRLDKADLTNTASSFICETPVLNNGVCGEAYALRTDVRTYNVLEGFKDEFAGDIAVFNEKNEEMTLTDGAFTPTESGIYYAHYTPVNKDGVFGDSIICPFYVFAEQPKVALEMEYPVLDMIVGVGTRIDFPAIQGISELSDKALTVSATVSTGEETVFSVADCSDGMTYTFETLGEYEVTFSCVDVSGYQTKESVLVSVTDIPVFMGVQFNDVYEKDVTMSLENVYALYNGEKFTDVNVLTMYPDGRTTTTKNLTFGQEGVYQLDFSYDYNGVTIGLTKYITVRQSAEALWVEQSGLTVQSDAVAPAYADCAYGGTMLSVTRALEAEYKNVVDVSDNTADDLLCELFVAPKTAGSLEFARLDIILTDIYNEENVVDICLSRPAWWESRDEDKKNMSVIALPQRDYTIDTLLKLRASESLYNYQHYYYYARSINSTFYGQISNNNEKYPSQSVRLFLDYETGVLYAEMASAGGKTGKVAVVDLKNEGYVGTGNAWQGFTTGEVRLSVRFSELTQAANVLVINLDGQNLSGAYTEDKTAPTIFLDYKGNDENDLPVGVVGMPYSIFLAYSRDLVDGLYENVTVSVWKRNGDNWIAYENTGMQFTPNEAGEYMLRYQATDIAGNFGEKEVVINVIEETELRPLQYYFNKDMPSSVFVGERYVLREGTTNGGSGVTTVIMHVSYNGENVVLDENNAFIIQKDGEYIISAQVSDYLGASNTDFTFKVNAIYADEPIIQEKTLPRVIVQGEEITFPEILAKRYSDSGVETVPTEIWLSKDGESYTKLTGLQYTPDTVGTLYVKIKSGNAQLIKEIQVTQAISADEKSALFTSQYLYATATPKADTAMLYTFDSDGKISVARKLDTRFADFDISVNDGENFSVISFTFTDSVNPAIAVTGKFIKNDGTSSYLELNDTRYYINNCSFTNKNLAFVVAFDTETNEILVGGNPIAKITYADNGDVFHGFTSGEVYLDFAFGEADGEYTIGVKSIAGQGFKRSIKSDKSGPTFKFLDEFNNIDAGEIVVVPQAVAFDFNGVASMCVTVTSPSGQVLYDNVDISQSSLRFEATEVGSYRFTYVALDLLGNESAPRNRGVDVADKVPPTITLSGTVPQTAKLNKTITLPLATISDDNTATTDIVFYVYALSPDGKMTILNYYIDVNGTKMEIEEYKNSAAEGGKLVAKDEYKLTPNQKGLYIIIYFAQDSHGATTTQRFEMRVQ